MKVTVRGALNDCSDCGSQHMGPACGGSFTARLRSMTIDPRALPNKDKKLYWDDEPMKDVFGLDRNERKEDLMEQTGGHGFFDRPEDVTPEAAKYFGLTD